MHLRKIDDNMKNFTIELETIKKSMKIIELKYIFKFRIKNTTDKFNRLGAAKKN